MPSCHTVERVSAVHPQIQAIIDEDAAEAAEAEPGPPSLESIRAGYLQTAIELGGAPEPVASAEDVVIARADGGGVPARVYRPIAPAAPLGTLVWFHGGGWIAGDLDGFDRVARQLANASGALCVSVDYRLAPEHPFPAALEDAHAALAWAGGAGATQLGSAPDRVVVGGDSAGGHLAALAVQRARDRVRAQMHVYPALDPACGSDAYRTYADGPMLTVADMRACWAAYLAVEDAAGAGDAAARPIDGDLAGLPPAFIAVAEHDPLRDDGLAYAAALRAAGVDVETALYDTMTHGFVRWGGIVEQAHELIARIGQATRSSIA